MATISLKQLTESVRQQRFSASDLTRSCARSLANASRAIGDCFVWTDADAAQTAAELIDQQLADGAGLPLAGVVFSAKELIGVSGMPDSAASYLSELPGHPMGEAPLVSQLKAQGAVVIGKTKATEFGLAQHALERRLPANPHDPLRVTGGSSSGSAAAIAHGVGAFSIGTDTGGSVRAPAAFCGVAGYLPTAESWPHDGMLPLAPVADRIGVLAPSVANIRFLYTAVSSVSDSLPVLGKVRLGIPTGALLADLDSEVEQAFLAAVSCLQKAGVQFTELLLPDLSVVERFFNNNLPAGLTERLGAELLSNSSQQLDPVTRARLEPWYKGTTVPELVSVEELAEFRQSVLTVIAGADVHGWILPTVPGLAPLRSSLGNVAAILEWQGRASRNTRPVNLLNLPAVNLPLPAGDHVFCGLQVVGADSNDSRLLALAAALELALKAMP